MPPPEPPEVSFPTLQKTKHKYFSNAAAPATKESIIEQRILII